MQFRVETFLNQYLPPRGTRVDAVFSVSARDATPAPGARRVVGLIGDRSGSMEVEKIAALKNALRVAVDQMDAGVEAFVVAFAATSDLVLPLTRMDEAGRRAAHRAIQRMEAGGGTVMSAALAQALAVFRQRAGALCQAILLTDGLNDPGDEAALAFALGECAGAFQADCRGVGTDWSPAQLRAVADRLLGTVRLVADPAGLARDFHDTLAAAMSRSVAAVRLRLWQPRNARLLAIRQAFPTELDLTGKVRPVDQRALDVPLGAWGEGARDYFATFDVTPLGLGEQMLVCRPSVVWPDPAGAGEAASPGGNVTVTWTEDAGLSARIDAQVAHYTGQAEKARAIQEGLEALERHDDDAATLLLGRALALAEQSGDAETTRRLREVIAPDATDGTLRLRRGAGKVAVMDLDVGSTRTVRAKRE
jgi:hypothetical protein